MNLRNDTFFRTVGPGWLAAGLLALGLTVSSAVAVPTESGRVKVSGLGNRALNFESNFGQYGEAAAFISRGANYYLALSPTEVRVTLQKIAPPPVADTISGPGVRTQRTVDYRSLLIQLPGANPLSVMTGEGEATGRANYFIGNDPAQWRTGVPAYDRVRVAEVYPGIDLLHYGNQQQLEYDFEIAPGANPDAITMRFTGADQIAIGPDGDLVLTLGADELRQPKPILYQTVQGQRREISGGFTLADSHTIKFTVGHYDHSLPLVIDPIVSYSKYLSGFGSLNDDVVWAVAVGGDGDVYLAGETMSPGLATTNAYQTNLAGVLAQHGDVFVTRQNNDVSTRVYFTYLGGNSYEAAFGLAVDAEGNAYLTGYTGSTNFPTSHAIQPNIAGKAPAGFVSPAVDCFISKLGPYGSNLVFSTYYGGSGTGYNGVGDDVGFGIALDASRNIFVAGYTSATNFPTLNTTYTNAGGLEDAFVLKLDPTGTNVVYAMRFGGTNSDIGRDVAVDPAGNPVVIGYTYSTNFPVTTNAFQKLLNNTTNLSITEDAFISKIAATSGTLTYSTFLGGTNSDRGIRLATDANGAAYLTGWTMSGDFPNTSTNFQNCVTTNAAFADAFVVKLDPSNTNLDYAIIFGGAAKDEAWDVAVDASGRAQIVGATESLNFPTNGLADLLGTTNVGGSDLFITEVDSNGNSFIYSGYIGSPSPDFGYGVALDAGGNAYFVGATVFGTSPTKPFIAKILNTAALSIAPAGTNVEVSWPGYAPEFSLQSRTNLLGTNGWSPVSTARVLTNARFVVALPITNAPRFFRLAK